MNKKTIAELPANVLGKKSEQLREKSPEFISVYANNVGIAMSNWDFITTFGRTIEREGEPVIQERVEVIMSKELAKVLALLMANNLQDYEEQFGEIKIPDLSKFQVSGKNK